VSFSLYCLISTHIIECTFLEEDQVEALVEETGEFQFMLLACLLTLSNIRFLKKTKFQEEMKIV
jgi:hypothetical protein